MGKLTILLCLLSLAACTQRAQHQSAAPEIGIVENYENAALLKQQGYSCLVESTQKLFSPLEVSEQEFEQHLQALKTMPVPLFGTNIFIPGHLKMVGPEADEQAVLAYTEAVFQRASDAGAKMIIWGSGGSRQVPPGFDRAKAREQFVAAARKVAAVAKKYDILLALESLNSTEANHINTVAEALEIVKLVDHENLRLCVDIYHMLKEGDSPAVIGQAKGYVVYCEIAEKEGRTPPGVHGEDFRPFLRELKEIGYSGKIVIECRWSDLASQGDDAYQYLHNQIEEVWGRQ